MYKIEYVKGFEKELRQLQPKDIKKVVARILLLANNPRPDNAIKLKGSHDIYRFRQGNYRVIYSIKDKVLSVVILRVAHRKDAYKDL